MWYATRSASVGCFCRNVSGEETGWSIETPGAVQPPAFAESRDGGKERGRRKGQGQSGKEEGQREGAKRRARRAGKGQREDGKERCAKGRIKEEFRNATRSREREKAIERTERGRS